MPANKKGKSNILDSHRKEPMSETVVKFLSSISEDQWIVEVDVRNSIAHNLMLMKQKIITESEGQQIVNNLIDILQQIKQGQFQIDLSYEDIHPYIEKLIIDKTGVAVGGKLHTGRSRNDQVATDIRMKIREEFIELTANLKELIDILKNRSEHFAGAIMPLYTHVQRGQVGTFGHFLQAYAFQILRIYERIIQTYDRINMCPLGACAIGGTSMPIDREYTAQLLGFDGIIYNSIDAISSRDYISEVLSILSDLAIIISRISEDLILWNSEDFGFVIIADEFTSVSSAMPQKKNPDTLEIIRGRAGKVIGALIEALMMQKGTPSGYNRDFQESKPPLITGFNTTKNAIKILSGVFETINIREENMKNAVLKSGVVALDISEYLVKKYNVPFRQAHQIIGALSKQLHELGPIEAYSPQRISKYAKDNLSLDIPVDNHIIKIMDPGNALDSRQSEGSPKVEFIKRGALLISEKNDEYSKQMETRKSKVDNAWKNLEKKIN